MTTPEQVAAAINTFEVARKVLGHAALVPASEVDRAFDLHRGGGTVRTGLIRYAIALVAAQEATSDDDSTAVIPSVDVARLRVSHQTCTGRTGLGVADGHLSGTRSEPFAPEAPRDIALWLVIPQWGMVGDRLFQHSNVFGQDGKDVAGRARPRAGHGDDIAVYAKPGYVQARDGSVLAGLRVLEGLAVLLKHGVTMERACAMAQERGVRADPEQVYGELESRRLGLWLLDRPWVQDAWRTLKGADVRAEIPEDFRAAKAAIRGVADLRGGPMPIRLGPPPRTVPLVDEELADWERELNRS